MCTSYCKCYEGDNGEIKEKWYSYGDAFFNKFGRNIGTVNSMNPITKETT